MPTELDLGVETGGQRAEILGSGLEDRLRGVEGPAEVVEGEQDRRPAGPVPACRWSDPIAVAPLRGPAAWSPRSAVSRPRPWYRVASVVALR